MVRQALAERYPDDVYTRGLRVYTTLRKSDQEVAYAALRRGVLEYDRRQGYRGPEGFAELPAAPSEDDYEEALAEHADSDDLQTAVDVGAQRPQEPEHIGTGELRNRDDMDVQRHAV